MACNRAPYKKTLNHTCVSQTAYARCTCPDEAHCGLRMLMLDVRNAISKILDRYTLVEIVDITLRKMRRDKIAPASAARSIDLEVLLGGWSTPLRDRSATAEGKSHAA